MESGRYEIRRYCRRNRKCKVLFREEIFKRLIHDESYNIGYILNFKKKRNKL